MTTSTPEPYEAAPHRWIALGVVAVALSLIVIDGTIVAVALPTIIGDLDLDLNQAQWVTASYAVVLAGLLLGAGRLADRLGRRRLLLAGVTIFAVASALAASADSGGTLIAARLLQGVGGAAVLPTTLSTVNAMFRGKDRAAAFGVWGAVISGAAALGPLLGGWLTTSFTWPWIFVVNIPIAVVVLVMVLLYVPETRAGELAPGLDIVGLVLSALGFGALVFGLIEGQTLGWWTPKEGANLFGGAWPSDAPISATPVFLVGALLLLVGFVFWERDRSSRGRSALLDLELFRLPTFRWGNLTAAMVAIGEFGIIFVLPLFLVNVLELSTLQAGFVLAAMALGAFLSGASARHVAAAIGAPMVVVLGLTLEVLGVALVALVISPSVHAWVFALVLVIYGIGLGLASAQLTGTTLMDVPPEESGQGSAAQSTSRQLGSALGTAVVGAALAIGLAATVPTALADVSGLPPGSSDQLTEATTESAGGIIPALSEQGTSSQLGEVTPEVVSALETGFADATRVALLSAGGFLLLGLASSFLVVRAARRRVVPDDEAAMGVSG